MLHILPQRAAVCGNEIGRVDELLGQELTSGPKWKSQGAP